MFCFVLFRTASIFEISGLTLVSVGAGLTGLGIIACFHSCCVVLCYRPQKKPPKQDEPACELLRPPDPGPIPNKGYGGHYDSNLPGTPYNAHNRMANGQGSMAYRDSSPPLGMPARSATSPKFFPMTQDDSDAGYAKWQDTLRELDRRRYRSQGNVNIQPVELDQSPEVRKENLLEQSVVPPDPHPYTDDLLTQHLRKKKSQTQSQASSKSIAAQPASDSRKSHAPSSPCQPSPGGRIRAKPIFREGDPPGGRSTSRDLHFQRESGSKSPYIPRNQIQRNRQYFHEDHFTFSDFDADDAFLPGPNQEKHLQMLQEEQEQQQRRENFSTRAARSQSPRVGRSSLKQPRAVDSSPPFIPGKRAPQLSRANQQYFSIESDEPVIQSRGPMSGGSTSSGRGSSNRVGLDQHDTSGPVSFSIKMPSSSTSGVHKARHKSPHHQGDSFDSANNYPLSIQMHDLSKSPNGRM